MGVDGVNDHRIDKTSIILFSLHSIISWNIGLDKNRLSQCFYIKKQTLDKYLKEMTNTGVLEPIKDQKGGVASYKLKRSGIDVINNIENIINETVLDPINSGFAKKVAIGVVLEHFRDPYEVTEFLNRLFFQRNSKASKIFQEILEMRPNSKVSRYLNEVMSIEYGGSLVSMENILRSSSIYSVSCEETNRSSFTHEAQDRSLLRAEVLRRMGDIEDAMCIYNGLLDRRKGIESSSWLLCMAGVIQCKAYENKMDECQFLIDKMLMTVKDPMEKAFFKKIKADVFQDLGMYQEASILYKSCLGFFSEKRFPMIRTTILNNLGVLYFRREEHKNATKLWEKALKIAKRVDLPYIISIISINLADVYGLMGRFHKAEKLLREARKVLESIKDLEGLSGIDFNQALVSIEKGEKDKALKYFERSEEFHLSYRSKLEERRRVFKSRMKAKGYC